MQGVSIQRNMEGGPLGAELRVLAIFGHWFPNREQRLIRRSGSHCYAFLLAFRRLSWPLVVGFRAATNSPRLK